MQIDFHHTTTYALARIAGFPHHEANIIAHAAQYVDDATCAGTIVFRNHEPYQRIASAHPYSIEDAERVEDILENANNLTNFETWAAFHFLPGNGGLGPKKGQNPVGVESFVCTTDSPVAKAMCDACLAAKYQPSSLHRLGITAHVFADTWVHRDFVGLRHPRNHVEAMREDGTTLLGELEEIGSHIAGSLPLGNVALGHMMALTLPDMPYLQWSYTNGDGVENIRDNPQDFLAASDRMVAIFGYYLGNPAAIISREDRSELLDAFQTIRKKDGSVRHKAWLERLRSGAFSFGALSPSEMADLDYVAKGEGSWKQKALNTTCKGDEEAPFEWTQAFETSDWKLFHDALKEHHHNLLNNILPVFGLSAENALK